jgi:hypothetical protein
MGAMLELNDKIARLEMLAEQYVIHLRSFKGRAPDALKRDVLTRCTSCAGTKSIVLGWRKSAAPLS